ncbi:MAG: sulfotransferase domain-containing protein [Verrucomicrobiae bacterium]|nr:sulfotransferase domain-containing protein [Verrucomicrobiae bacterium]
MKIPTTSLLIPFWKKICDQLDISLSVVIALRNPVSVATSVEESFEDLPEKSLWIWISSLLSSLIHSEGHERVLVDYDELIKNPSRQMERVAGALNLKIDEEQLRSYSAHFIDPSLRHQFFLNYHFANHDLCLQLAVEIYDALLAVAMDQKLFSDLQKPLQKCSKVFASVQGLLTIFEMHEFTIATLVDLNLELRNSLSLSKDKT